MSNNGAKGQAGVKGFQSRKDLCLSKRDRSSAGRIDPKAVEICAAINTREEYYTTSSCAGRCFLYCGDGIKSHHHFVAKDNDEIGNSNEDLVKKQPTGTGHGFFHRFRVNHDVIRDAERYFNFDTLDPEDKDGFDPRGGGDPVRNVAQYDYKEQLENQPKTVDENQSQGPFTVIQQNNTELFSTIPNQPTWLRYEPFILHVMCRSLEAAENLMKAARPAFKNVGLTSWKHGFGRYIVAIWGDEGLDLPVTTPNGPMHFLFRGQEDWLKQLVNERHDRNWRKIERFVGAVKAMPEIIDQVGDDWVMHNAEFGQSSTEEMEQALARQTMQSSAASNAPKRFDVVGDIALLHSIPDYESETDLAEIGNAIMKRNKNIKVVAVRSNALSGTERSPGEEGIKIIAGAQRSPLITSHMEYGIKCVVDLSHTFFSSRMGPERLRICQQVARGEKILVLFCGVGMDALQLAGRTEATILAVELNPIAYQCAQRAHRMLLKNKASKCPNAAERLTFVQGDAIECMSKLEPRSFDRILAPRPKEGNMDGDLGVGDGGVDFLRSLLPLMKNQGECHWYDFAADWELPNCERTRNTIEGVCRELGLEMEVIHVAKVGSIAKRQLRICMDFRLIAPEIKR